MLTSEQKAWLGSFLGEAAPAGLAGDDTPPSTDKANGADPTGSHDPAAANAGAAAGPATSPGTDRIAIAPVIPIILGGVKTLLGELICRVTIQNNTSKTLTLDGSSTGKFISGAIDGALPKAKLAPNGDTATFVAHSTGVTIPILNIGLSADHVDGEIRYFVGDDKTIWSCRFENPRTLTDPLGTNKSTTKLAGPSAGKFDAQGPQPEHGADVKFFYALSDKGGPTPVPPSPTPGAGGAQTSCLVTVVNQTKSTLFLRKADKASGDYMTQPATSLAPGASTQFAFVETPGSNQAEIRGLMTWEVDDPKTATWDLMWDNPTGQKNFTAAFLKPDNTGLHSLDQIGQGDENVPVTFTLSGGAQPQPTTIGKMTMTVENKSDQPLTLSASNASRGTFQSAPPSTIAPGATATLIATDGTDGKGSAGTVIWQVGAAKAAVWTLSWDKTPGQDPQGIGKVEPDTAGFKSAQSAKKAGDSDAAATFTLSGGAAPAVDDEFAPPPKSKQPTLRKGDTSPDGWVEYAQRMMNKNKLNQPVDGKFDAAMEKKIHDYQAAHNLQPDGVIGNQTWSALREADVIEAVGTDGRKPHTFEEKGAQARFVDEKPDATGYRAKDDFYWMYVVSTGEQAIDKNKATIKVTQKNGKSHTHSFEIGAVVEPSPDGQGNFHAVQVPNFISVFAIEDPATIGDCTVDAYLDAAIGGDRFTGPIRVTT